MQLSIRGDYRRVLKDLRLQKSKITERARQRALRRTANDIRKKVLRQTAADAGIQQKFIRKRLKVYSLPRQKKIAIWFGFQPIKAIHVIGNKSDKAQAKYMARFTGSPFVATMPSGHKGWFARKPGSRHRKGKNNNPDKPELPIGEVMVHYGREGRKNLIVIANTLGPRVFPRYFREEINKALAKEKAHAR